MDRPRQVFTSGVQAVLLLLATPVLVPTLIYFYISSKRWGRVDWVLLGSVGAVMVLLSSGSWVSLLVMLVAAAAASLLFILRFQRLDSGIFLGYSSTVANCLIFGGSLVLLGTCAFVPWSALARLENVLGFSANYDTARIPKTGIPIGRHVVIGGPITDHRAYDVSTANETRFSTSVAGAEAVVPMPRELWTQHDRWVGNHVLVSPSSPPAGPLVIPKVTISWRKGGVKEDVAGPLALWSLAGTEGRVWFADDAGSVASPKDMRGVALFVYTSREISRWWAKSHSTNLPYMGVIVLSSKCLRTDVQTVKSTWFLLTDARWPLWVVYDGRLDGSPKLPIEGITEAIEWLPPPPGSAATVVHSEGRGASVIRPVSATEYVKRNGLFDAFWRGIRWNAAFAIIPGLLLIGAGLLVASRE